MKYIKLIVEAKFQLGSIATKFLLSKKTLDSDPHSV
jgi:hypothetical protein